MEIVEHILAKPDSWNFQGANWSDPDPCDARYWYAIILALLERAAFAEYDVRRNALMDGEALQKLAIAAADATIGKHCPSNLSGNDYSLWWSALFGYEGDVIGFIRRVIGDVSIFYVDKSKLKEALNLKQTDESTGEWKINITRAEVYMPYYSYAVLAAKHGDITKGGGAASFYFDETARNDQAKFLKAAKACIDDMYLIYVDRSLWNNCGFVTVSSAEEGTEGYDKFDVTLECETKYLRYSVNGISGYPEKKRHALSYHCGDDLYSQRNAMKQRIFATSPMSASKAVSDAVDYYKSSEPDMSGAVPNPGHGGQPVDPLSDKTWYDYPRRDTYAHYERKYIYDQERNPMSDDYYKKSGLSSEIEVQLGYTGYGSTAHMITSVTNEGTHKFSWSEPRGENDPEGKEYDDGEEDIGPTFSASLSGYYTEFECYAPLGFEKGSVAELYSFAYIRSSSSKGTTDETRYKFIVPEGSNISSTEMEVDDPAEFQADETGKFKITIGSKAKFPTDVIVPEPWPGPCYSINGYYASTWLFINGLGAFKFKPA